LRRFELNVKQAAQVSQMFDADGTGSVDYEEFERFCNAPNAQTALRITEAIANNRIATVNHKNVFEEAELMVRVERKASARRVVKM